MGTVMSYIGIVWLLVADKYRRKLITGKAGTEPLAAAGDLMLNANHVLTRVVPYRSGFAVGFT